MIRIRGILKALAIVVITIVGVIVLIAAVLVVMAVVNSCIHSVECPECSKSQWDTDTICEYCGAVLMPDPDGSIAARYHYVPEASDTIDGHDCVDLGLSVKWAMCNVGASSPEDGGDHYAWGETDTKPDYTNDNCSTSGKDIGDIAGTSRDVAHVKWGGSWRMPTKAEYQELLDSCQWVKTVYNGVRGIKVMNNGNSIFLPIREDEGGWYMSYYWSSTPWETGDDSECSAAYSLGCFVNFDNEIFVCWSGRCSGNPVRPVTDK